MNEPVAVDARQAIGDLVCDVGGGVPDDVSQLLFACDLPAHDGTSLGGAAVDLIHPGRGTGAGDRVVRPRMCILVRLSRVSGAKPHARAHHAISTLTSA